MTTQTKPVVDLSSFPTDDGKPLAETYRNGTQMLDLLFVFYRLMEAQGRTRFTVGGNQFLYYNPLNRRENLAPDVFVALDVAPGPRDVWFTWEEGKCPDVVFEISSPSTEKNDLGTGPKGKLRIYAELGAREYYVYDPQLVMQPILKGFELRQGRFAPLPMDASGGIMSPLLRAELRPMPMAGVGDRLPGTYLRVIDARTGQPFPVPEELQHDYEGLQHDYEGLQHDYVVTQQRLSAEQQARLAEQQARYEAERAQQAAEQRAVQAEAELEQLRAALARQHDSPPDQA